MSKPVEQLYKLIQQIRIKNEDYLSETDPRKQELLRISREDYYQLVEIASNLAI